MRAFEILLYVLYVRSAVELKNIMVVCIFCTEERIYREMIHVKFF